MKKYDVVGLGELLIDFTENGYSSQGNPIMEVNPGGAPCNLLSVLTKLGKKTSFIGKIGRDMFGDQLRDAVEEVGIDTTGLAVDEEVHTTLAFVHTFPGGDREFSFYRNPGADMMLSVSDLKEELIKDTTIFHYGSLSMTHEGCNEATFKAIKMAKEAGAVLTYDPNLRVPLWDNLDHAKEAIGHGMEYCDIMKISDNEIQWFTGEDDFDKGIKILQDTYHIPLILLSMGSDGSRAYQGDVCVEVKPFLQENTIETTGAGDCFGGCVLNYVLEHGFRAYTKQELTEMLTFANAGASIVTTRKGALRVMPTREEIETLIKEKSRM